jgi:hypothetical protein
MAERHRRRLERQLQAFLKRAPAMHARVSPMLHPRGWPLRVPLGLLLIAGGFLAILPFFGLWMIPLGLILLAFDLPILRPSVNATLIRARRKWSTWRRSGPRDP